MTDVKPSWWQENEQLREEMDLPEYQPPRFIDGTYTYEVKEPLEDSYECQIRFVGIDTRYPDEWEVWVNNEPVFEIGRHRDEKGNTVYKMTAETFRELITTYLMN